MVFFVKMMLVIIKCLVEDVIKSIILFLSLVIEQLFYKCMNSFLY